MIISFFEHKTIRGCYELSTQIEIAISENIHYKEKVFFYCGGYGEFDMTSESSLPNEFKESLEKMHDILERNKNALVNSDRPFDYEIIN